MSSNTALGWVAAGLGFFAVVGTTMKLLAPAERRPWVRACVRGGALTAVGERMDSAVVCGERGRGAWKE